MVKIGSALLVDDDGRVRARLARCARRRSRRAAAPRPGGDRGHLGRDRARPARRSASSARALRLEEKQAAAAVGQINLAHAYQASLAQHGLPPRSCCSRSSDTESRRRYLNARATIEALLKLGVVPVVNENDTVATNEIRFGDNDRLSARVAVMASADQLVLLSDVDGLYTADPAQRSRPPGTSPMVERDHAGDRGHGRRAPAPRPAPAAWSASSPPPGSRPAPAARWSSPAGRRPRPLARARRRRPRCTRFPARATPRRARKEWIAGALGAMGVLRIDAGAARALRRGSSLLPAGVTAVEGAFERGDAVMVRDPDGNDVAKGLSAYDAADARRIGGRKTEQIAAAARLSRPRRADPSRRSGAALERI